jgi:hypothetical protein
VPGLAIDSPGTVQCFFGSSIFASMPQRMRHVPQGCCLDDAALPTHDSTRLAIRATGKSLKQVCQEILHAVAGVPLQQWQYADNENELL